MTWTEISRVLLVPWLAALSLTGEPCWGQVLLPSECLPSEGVSVAWKETFLETRDLEQAGWRVIGNPAWRVVRECLDGGNGDLFPETAVIRLPPGATGQETDYLVSTLIWNTQREGHFFVAVRFVDPDNYYACEYVSSGGRLALFLVKVRDGVRSVLNQLDSRQAAVRIPDLTYGAGKRNAAVVSVGVFGDRICASVGGGASLEATDADLMSGGIALGQADYHPFFDDVTVYFIAGRVPGAEEVPGGIEFRISVPDRDEGNAIVVDLLELGLSPCALEEEEGELWIRLGPVASESEALRARQYLDTAGIPFRELQPESSDGVF